MIESKFIHRLHSEQGKNKLNMDDSRNEVLNFVSSSNKCNFYIKECTQNDNLSKVTSEIL
jgi:hypothetical protein